MEDYTTSKSTQNTIPNKRMYASKGGVHTLVEEEEVKCTNVIFHVKIQTKESE